MAFQFAERVAEGDRVKPVDAGFYYYGELLSEAHIQRVDCKVEEAPDVYAGRVGDAFSDYWGFHWFAGHHACLATTDAYSDAPSIGETGS